MADEKLVYKILGRSEWDEAVARGRYDGSADDRRDGFIHFSSASQLAATAAKYFSGRTDLLLVGVPAAALGAGLKWEPSRGGALFPHLYGALDPALASMSQPLALGPDGAPLIPGDLER